MTGHFKRFFMKCWVRYCIVVVLRECSALYSKGPCKLPRNLKQSNDLFAFIYTARCFYGKETYISFGFPLQLTSCPSAQSRHPKTFLKLEAVFKEACLKVFASWQHVGFGSGFWTFLFFLVLVLQLSSPHLSQAIWLSFHFLLLFITTHTDASLNKPSIYRCRT